MTNRDKHEVVSRVPARVNFEWAGQRGGSSLSISSSAQQNPLHSALSETLSTARSNANSLVLRKGSNGRFYGVYGPSVGSMFLGNSAIGPQLRSDVEKRIQEQFIKGFQRVLDSAKRGR